MATTLKDDIASDLCNVLLNTDEFAETVTFYPGGGGSSRRIVALLTHHQQSEDNSDIEYINDRISVTVSNDPTHAKGGIATPSFGTAPIDVDCLSRDGEPEDLRYAFTGNGRKIAGGWILDYERPRALAFGTAQRRH